MIIQEWTWPVLVKSWWHAHTYMNTDKRPSKKYTNMVTVDYKWTIFLLRHSSSHHPCPPEELVLSDCLFCLSSWPQLLGVMVLGWLDALDSKFTCRWQWHDKFFSVVLWISQSSRCWGNRCTTHQSNPDGSLTLAVWFWAWLDPRFCPPCHLYDRW